MTRASMRSGCVWGLTAILTGAVVITARPWRTPAAAWSRAALTSTFDSGIRNLVAEWDPEDRRPAAVRRQALFERTHPARHCVFIGIH